MCPSWRPCSESDCNSVDLRIASWDCCESELWVRVWDDVHPGLSCCDGDQVSTVLSSQIDIDPEQRHNMSQNIIGTKYTNKYSLLDWLNIHQGSSLDYIINIFVTKLWHWACSNNLFVTDWTGQCWSWPRTLWLSRSQDRVQHNTGSRLCSCRVLIPPVSSVTVLHITNRHLSPTGSTRSSQPHPCHKSRAPHSPGYRLWNTQ